MSTDTKYNDLLVRLVDTQKECIDALKTNNRFLEEQLAMVVNRYKSLEEQALALQKQYNTLVSQQSAPPTTTVVPPPENM